MNLLSTMRPRRPAEKLTAAAALLCFTLSPVLAVASSSSSSSGNTSHDVTRDAALAVGVEPPSSRNGPKWIRRAAWTLEKRLVQIMTWFDPCSPPDSKLSLRVLWWKAIAATDQSSPVFEKDGVTYDMLPTGFRWLVRYPFHPRWVHSIIEIRTAYLDQAIARIRSETKSSTKIRLISMGGGYDARSIRLQLQGIIDEAVELDLPKVIEAKRRLLGRLCKRRPDLNTSLPDFYPVDLTDIDTVRKTLVDVLSGNGDGNRRYQPQWYNIFLFEGVLMYLPEGDPCKLLQACRQALNDAKGAKGCVVFADALENIPNDDLRTARMELPKYGWRVVEWLPKGGRTRHMGRADMKYLGLDQ
mmetsp:Transcript_22160/g.49480  ORF Transcript_22160/g.49480 Transcript_22160/m.49480 type:complete len:357 (-) Transcript_22160:251-1321(-)